MPSVTTSTLAGSAAKSRLAPSRSTCISAASVLGFLLLWQALSSSGVISPIVLPGPLTLLGGVAYLAGPDSNPSFQLERDMSFTLMRLLGGFVVAAALAIPIGVGTALWRPLERLLMPFFAIFMSIPALAIVPILMLLTGIGDTTDFTVVVLAAFVPIAVYVFDGVRLIDKKYFWTARSFGSRPVDVLRCVILPGAVVPLVAGLRMGMGYAWRSLIATESLTALTGGLGYTIFQASQFFDTQTIYIYMAVTALLGFAIEALFRAIERRTAVRWGVLASGRR